MMENKRDEDIVFVLGVEATNCTEMPTLKPNYNVKLEVSESVYNFLCMHDIEYKEDRTRVFIYNSVRYVDLGPKLKLKRDDK